MPREGSISHGTLRTQDLLPCFLRELESLDIDAFNSFVLEEFPLIGVSEVYNHLQAMQDIDEFWHSEETIEILFNTMDRINEMIDPDLYFGTLEGDASDFGYWPVETEEDEDFDDDLG